MAVAGAFWIALALCRAELLPRDECDEPGNACSQYALQLTAKKKAMASSECKDLQSDDVLCERDVKWAKDTGIKQHPEWYPGLSESSSVLEFQCKIFQQSPEKCQKPCGVPCAAASPSPPASSGALPSACAGRTSPEHCLCVLDIDRTLTSKQGMQGSCGGSRASDLYDSAYGGGKLVLSQLGASGLMSTMCSKCYVGIVSHGDGSGQLSPERKELMKALETEAMRNLVLKPFNAYWSDMEMKSPFYVDYPDARKQEAVFNILDWYAAQEVCIPHSNTYFFDDKDVNIKPFKGTGLNAIQISCSSRDPDLGMGEVGLCGAKTDEIKQIQGVSLCKIDCQWATWAPWSTCSASCGGGQRSRHRNVLIKPRNGGQACGAPVASEECNLDACPTTTTTTTTAATTEATAEDLPAVQDKALAAPDQEVNDDEPDSP